MPGFFKRSDILVSNVIVYWSVDIFYETDARWCKRCYGIWKIQSKLLTEHKDKITFKDVAGID